MGVITMSPSSLILTLLRVVSCLVATLVSPAVFATDINGSGSTFVHPIMLKWAARYYAKTDVKVSYMPIGSGGGIQQIKAGMVTFGASDKPLPPDELKAAGLAQFPLVIGGVVPVVNIEGIKPGQLKFTGEVLANIYLGKIISWTDPAIAALNPDVKFPNLKITVTRRADSSGTTFNWTNYLSKVSPAWKSGVGEGTVVKWPVGSAGNGNEGVARYVNFVKGAIGYVELAYALEHRMIYARLKNKSGEFVTPSLESFQAAAANAEWKSPDFYEILTEEPGKDAWPITATVFILMLRHPSDSAKTAEALRFFKWSLEQGTADARSLNYVSLPGGLVTQIEAYWGESIK